MKRYTPTIRAIVSILLLSITGAWAGTIHLRAGEIDTTDTRAFAEAAAEPRARGAGYYLVALKGPVTDADKLALTLAGADLIEYIPDFAFLVKIDRGCVQSLRKLDCVDWVGPFKPEYKSDPAFLAKARGGQYIVQVFGGDTADRVIRKVKARRVKCAGDSARTCRVIADASQLAELAKSGSVAWIEPYVQPKLCNDVAATITGVPDVRRDLGLHGAGQIIGVADSGLDTGDLATISADFAGRIDKTFCLRRPGEWSDLIGHGTHTTGSALGSGVLSGANPLTHSYDGTFAGVAPEAHLVFQSIGDQGQLVFPPLHLGELFQPAYDNGARVHSDSWGSAVAGQYTVYSNEVDQFVWDHKDFTVVFAVGNEAVDRNADGIIDKHNLYAPATAKNCIAVGATETSRSTGGYQMGYGQAWPSDYPAAPIKYDLISNNPNGMTAFSGRGPTDDGRVKPDICAPGTNIISCRTHAVDIAGWGAYDSNYMYWGGTSMPTPQVAGGAALVREYFQKEKGISPSAALVKAALISGAVDMSPGQYGSGSAMELQPAPDFSQGWGRMNVSRTLSPDPPTVNEFADASTGLSTGEYCEYQYQVTDATVPFKATLVWTDYPGAVHAAKELVNDLDLSVATPSGLTYPTITNQDHLNNVEQVNISHPALGTYTVRVAGSNVPMGPQDHALVVSGGMPSTYISGMVRSASGAGVRGANIAIVAVGIVKRLSTNTDGKYLTHVPPGAYSVQVSKSGWSFTPRAKLVTVAGSPVSGIDFQGSGSPGTIKGTVRGAVGGVVSRIIETPHPYLNNFDQTYIITAHEGATRTRVHFAEIDLMNDGDIIRILDAGDNLIDTFTGKGEDVWSSWVSGNVAKIRIITNDYGNIGYGFYIDGYETDLIDQGGVDGVTFTLTPASGTAASAPDGTYTLASVPAGTYTITPSKAYWTFQPASKIIDVPSGGTASSVDFQALPPGSISGMAQIVSSRVVATNVQSPHPYLDNYDNTWQITADPSATRIRIHFSRLATEPAWDFVYLMDGDGAIIEIYTGSETDLWTPWIDGNIAQIELTSDVGNTDYGFAIDKYEVESLGNGLEGATIQLDPDARTATTASDGSFGFAQVPVGIHTVVPKVPYLGFDPPAAQVSISAAMSEYLLFYVKPAEFTNCAFARSLADNMPLMIAGLKVSAVFNGFFYVQSPNIPAGIRVQWPGPVTQGQTVTITGTMETVDGERRVKATGAE